jgi:hypothetical protein
MNGIAQIAKKEIEDLRSQGIEPTLEEIIWLNDLGLKVENPAKAIKVAAGSPVQCGGKWLWPFTIQSGAWFDNYAVKLFTSADMLIWCLGFALNLGRLAKLPDYCIPKALRRKGQETIRFSQLTEFDLAKHAVNQWALRQPFTFSELKTSIVEVMPQLKAPFRLPPPPKSKDDPARIAILDELVAGTGQSREYWEAELSDHAYGVMHCIYKQRAASFGEPIGDLVDELSATANGEFMAASAIVKKNHTAGEGPDAE